MSRPKLSVTAPEPEPTTPDVDTLFERITDARASAREWLLPGRIGAGSLGIVEGDTSVGKTTFLAAIAASVTTGAPFLGRSGHVAGQVLWVSAEADPQRDLLPLVTAAGGFAPFVRVPTVDQDGERRRLTIPACIPQLRSLCAAHPVRLIIFEPLISHLSSGLDPESGPDCRSALDPLQQFAMSTGVTILMSRGLRKDRHGPRTLHGAGSATIGDTVRSVVLVDAPDRSSMRRYLIAVKCPAGPVAPTMQYQISPHAGAVQLTEWRQLNEAEASAAEVAIDPCERQQLTDAEALLISALRDGPVNASSVKRLADAAMIPTTTLFRARQRLGIRSVRHGYASDGYSEWIPPEGGFQRNLGGIPSPVESKESMKSRPRKARSKPIHSIDSEGEGIPPSKPRKRKSTSSEPVSDATME